MSTTTFEAPRTTEFAIGDLFAVMKSIDVTLKELVSVASRSRAAAGSESQALALLIEIGPNIAEIAERLGVHRSTLYRWPKFMRAVALARTGGGGARVTAARYGVVREDDSND